MTFSNGRNVHMVQWQGGRSTHQHPQIAAVQSPGTAEGLLLNGHDLECYRSQLSFWVPVAPIALFCLGLASWSLYLSLVLSFCHPPTVPWRWKRHSGGNAALLPANEDVLESPRRPLSNDQSGAGPAVHRGRSFSHILSSIGWRHQP